MGGGGVLLCCLLDRHYRGGSRISGRGFRCVKEGWGWGWGCLAVLLAGQTLQGWIQDFWKGVQMCKGGLGVGGGGVLLCCLLDRHYRGGSRISGRGFRCVKEGWGVALLMLSHFS